ncbi:GAF domain-containing sensor histidine kinase [Anthocerotibacter panamensis]|uniref:GAF domain-containing sensor histidine kinase n=1 Tax=Anthocerotibacter panamensis TaxID=2857077 RepID=UPI001C40506D|nr:GAF domain-containing protein [Anthocerotibacter panamensis]
MHNNPAPSPRPRPSVKAQSTFLQQLVTLKNLKSSYDREVFEHLAPTLLTALGGGAIGVGRLHHQTREPIEPEDIPATAANFWQVDHLWSEEKQIQPEFFLYAHSLAQVIVEEGQAYQQRAVVQRGVHTWESLTMDPLLGQYRDIRSFAGCPVYVQGTCLGLVFVLDPEARTFTLEQLTLLEIFAAHIAACWERRIVQRQELQRQRVLVERLSTRWSTFSRELKSSATNVRLAVHLLRDDSAISLQGYINILEAECQRQMLLVEALLDPDRLESRAQELVFASLDVNKLLDRLYRVYAENIAARGIQLEWVLTEGLPELESDSTALEWVLVELLKHALQSVSVGGKLSMSAHATAPWLYVMVQGMGPDVPLPLDLPEVTDLSQIKHLVSQLGGKLYIQQGEGTCRFSLVFVLAGTRLVP